MMNLNLSNTDLLIENMMHTTNVRGLEASILRLEGDSRIAAMQELEAGSQLYDICGELIDISVRWMEDILHEVKRTKATKIDKRFATKSLFANLNDSDYLSSTKKINLLKSEEEELGLKSGVVTEADVYKLAADKMYEMYSDRV